MPLFVSRLASVTHSPAQPSTSRVACFVYRSYRSGHGDDSIKCREADETNQTIIHSISSLSRPGQCPPFHCPLQLPHYSLPFCEAWKNNESNLNFFRKDYDLR